MSFLHRRTEQRRAEAAHATAVAVCPTCQVPPGSPCRDSTGYAIDDVHPARIKEAGAAA